MTIKVSYEDIRRVTRSHALAMQGRHADFIASRAVALREQADERERPVRQLGAGGHGLPPDRTLDPGSTQPRWPTNDLMPA